MSPMLEEMLVSDVMPRLRAAARSVPRVGHEDTEEIVQDCTLMAARTMDSAEKAGQKFGACNVVYYTVKAARSGRRSHYSGKGDVMSARCQFQGLARLEALDDEIEFESGESGTLHDITATFEFNGQESDPAEEAARNIDWKEFLAAHSARHRTAILVLVEGGNMREAGRRCGLQASAATLLRRRIAADLLEFFGEEVIRRLIDGTRPGWESDLRQTRERHLNHANAGREAASPDRR